jgi:hypothetical protein
VGCLSRIGCLTLGVLLGVGALAFVLATRSTGPRFEDGVWRYEVGGEERRVPITDAAARSFDAKLNGELPRSALPEAITAGVPVSEEELNSRIAEELARNPVASRGARVERVFVRLTSAGARAYVHANVYGVDAVLSSDLIFQVERGRVRVELRDPHAGRLPVGFLLPSLLAAASDAAGIEETIALVIPPQVQAIRHEEGRLRVVVNPLAGGMRDDGQPVAEGIAGRTNQRPHAVIPHPSSLRMNSIIRSFTRSGRSAMIQWLASGMCSTRRSVTQRSSPSVRFVPR